jgi:alpha-glucosidase
MVDARDPWWKRAVVYQIYPRSFADASGSGVGDLAGISGRLDYLSWLGVDAIWLSPFFKSPMHDFGYDVADYCDVDPIFGSLADFDALLEAAHTRDIKMMIDWVPAHTSSEHPWFVDSRSSRTSSKRDWYVWRDPASDGGPPNNWRAAFLQVPAWTLDAETGQYYLHSFLKEQPDLDWNNPAVVEAMLGTLRFWLDRGVDGFRADVIHNIGKTAELADVEGGIAKIPHCALNDEAVTHEHLRRIRSVLDEYPGDRAVVGEVFLLSTEQVAPYYGDGDELHMSFNFPPLFAPWTAHDWRGQIDETFSVLGPVQGWPTWVLSNHDQKRHHTRYGSEARARAAAVLLLTVRGTPFLYMGEELGLEDAVVPEDRVVDPGGRDGCRAPIPWSAEDGHGWGPEPWLPWPPAAERRSVESARGDEDSILHLYRRLLGVRRGSEALTVGEQRHLDAPEGVLVYERCAGDDRRVVAINFEAQERAAPVEGDWIVEVSSDGAGEGEAYAASLGPDRALILRPAD